MNTKIQRWGNKPRTEDSAILCDQIKSLDWQVRNAKRIGSVPPALMREVMARILALVDPGE